jgi:hypothetical protein
MNSLQLLTTVRLALDKDGPSIRVVSEAVAWTVSRSSGSAVVPNFVINDFAAKLTEEIVGRIGDQSAIDFVEAIVQSGADNFGAELASRLFDSCLKSAPSAHSSTAMAAIAGSKRLNTPKFWEQLDKLGWKSADSVVLHLLDLLASEHIEPSSAAALVATSLVFISEMCTDVVSQQALLKLSQVRTYFIFEQKIDLLYSQNFRTVNPKAIENPSIE